VQVQLAEYDGVDAVLMGQLDRQVEHAEVAR
jgi:hypothetical protein